MRILPQGRTIVASVERCTVERRGAPDAEHDGSQAMQNYFSMETEASVRRREWERAAEADARAAQARSTNGRVNWPQIALASLRLLSAPRLPLISSLTPERPSPTCDLLDGKNPSTPSTVKKWSTSWKSAFCSRPSLRSSCLR